MHTILQIHQFQFPALDKKLDPAQLNDAFKIAMMIGDVRLMEEIEGVAGDIYILDASVVSPSHLGKLSPSALKKFFICVQVNNNLLFF